MQAGRKKNVALRITSAVLLLYLLAAAGSAALANDSAGSSSKEPSGASLPPGTLELIRKQTEIARQRAVAAGKADAENEIVKASNQAKTLQERAERQAAEAAATRNQAGSEPSVLTPPEQLEALRNQAVLDGERLKRLGQIRAELKEQESQEKAAEIERQAENLQDQLLHKHRSYNQEIELNPVGTNLYVRNYSHVAPLVAPMHAQAGSITPQNAGGIKTTSASANFTDVRTGLQAKASSAKLLPAAPPSNGQATQHASTSVEGQVLPQY